jgi:hypothetical protein
VSHSCGIRLTSSSARTRHPLTHLKARRAMKKIVLTCLLALGLIGLSPLPAGAWGNNSCFGFRIDITCNGPNPCGYCNPCCKSYCWDVCIYPLSMQPTIQSNNAAYFIPPPGEPFASVESAYPITYGEHNFPGSHPYQPANYSNYTPPQNYYSTTNNPYGR